MSRPLALVAGGACALAAGMAIGRFAYTPLLPAMQRDGGLAIAAAGYVASANFLGYLVGALLAMRVARAHRGRWFAAGLALSVATTFAMAGASAPSMLGAIRLLAGVASAFVLIHGSSIALDVLAHAGRPGWFGGLYAGIGLGIALTAGLVEWMTRAGAHAATMWLALGTVAALLSLPALAVRDDETSRTGAPAAAAGAPRAPHPNERRALAWLTLAYGGLGFGYVITATFLVVMIRGRPDWRPYEMLVWMCVGLAGAPSNHLWMRIAERIDPYRAMTAAYVLQAAGVLAAVSGAHLAVVLLGAVLLGGTFMAITALGLTTGRLLARAESGATIGRMTAAFGLGQILGPAVGGWLAERAGGFLWPSALAAATLVAAAAMVARARREALSRPP